MTDKLVVSASSPLKLRFSVSDQGAMEFGQLSSRICGIRSDLIRLVERLLEDAATAETSSSGSPGRVRCTNSDPHRSLDSVIREISTQRPSGLEVLGEVVEREDGSIEIVPESVFEQLLTRYADGGFPHGALGTLLRATRYVISIQLQAARTCLVFQEAFFRTGDQIQLKPLEVRSVAERIDVSRSTLSKLMPHAALKTRDSVINVRSLMPTESFVRRERIRKELQRLRSDPMYFSQGKWLFTNIALADFMIARLHLTASVDLVRRDIAELKRES